MNFLFLGHGPIAANYIRRYIAGSQQNVGVVVSRAKIKNDSDRISVKEKLDLKDLENIDVVINSWKSLKSLNRGWETQLLKSISIHHSKEIKFVNLSSVSIYGECPFEVNETSDLNPINDYGIAKLEFESYLKQISMPNLINLRLSNVFGDINFDDILNKAYRAIMAGDTLEILEPASVVRDFIEVKKAVTYIDNVLHLPHLFDSSSSVDLNISGGYSLFLGEVIEIIEQITQEKLIANVVPSNSQTIMESRVSNEKLRHLIGVEKSSPEKEIRTYIQGLLD